MFFRSEKIDQSRKEDDEFQYNIEVDTTYQAVIEELEISKSEEENIEEMIRPAPAPEKDGLDILLEWLMQTSVLVLFIVILTKLFY